MDRLTTSVLVVGGGAAGMAAALAASAKTDVTLVDDNPLLGGQIWRAELGKIKSPDATRLIAALDAGKIRVVNQAQIFASAKGDVLIAETRNGNIEFEYKYLIIATGAREQFLPFPGWTLPNVFGAGGLQALVKGGMSVKDKRVAIAGTGALLLAVADYFKAKGAKVVSIAEQASAARVNRFALGLWRSPGKLVQAAMLRTRLIGVPYLTDCWVTSATGEDKLESVTLGRNGKAWSVDCDLLACGFHLVPNLELPAMLGCKTEGGSVAVDELQCTSEDNIYCAGEPTGIDGVEASLVEGKIAGLAATGETEAARSHFAERDKTRRFGDALNRLSHFGRS